jgi:hypothetical protein
MIDDTRMPAGADYDDEPLDLSALGAARLEPVRDAARWERAVHAILRAAAPELARRAAGGSVLALLVQWSRPVLVAAAAVALAFGALTVAASDSSGPGSGDAGVAGALGTREPVASWISEERAPTRADLVQAVNEWDAP